MTKEKLNSTVDLYLACFELTRQDLLKAKFYLQIEFNNIIDDINKGQLIEGHNKLIKIQSLLRDLKELHFHNPILKKRYLKKIISASRHDYFGLRLECHTAGILTNRRISFQTPDPPDFLLNLADNKVALECTNCHVGLVKLTRHSPLLKIKNAIKKKSEKSYHNNWTALFIDTTNLSFNYPGIFSKNQRETINFVHREFEKFDFGSVLLFNWLINGDNQNLYQNHYNRIDNQKIDRNLKLFLDKYFPRGHTYIRNFAVSHTA